VVNDGSGYRLPLSSDDSGAANAISLQRDAGVTIFDDATLGQSSGTVYYDELEAAQDAVIQFGSGADPLTISSATNTVTDLATGLTLNLLSASPGTNVTISVARESSGMEEEVQAFVDAYNDAWEYITTQTAYDAATETRGVLMGDLTIESIKSRMQGILIGSVDTGGNYKTLRSIGISMEDDGSLTFDTATFSEAVTEQFPHPDPESSIIYHSDLVGVGDEVRDDPVIQKSPPPDSWQDWRVINTGAGGYGLAWDSDETTNAQVGEAIALREKEYNLYHWRTGVIRWLQNTDEHGLQIGVQLLAPRAIVVEVETIRNRSYSQILPLRVLMLPGMKTLQHPPSVLVRAGVFQSGDILEIAMLGKKLYIELGDIGESPSFFTQFFYTSSEIKSSATPKEQFEDLWRRL